MNNTTHSSDTAHNQQDTTQQTRHRCDAVIKTPDSIVHFPVAWVNGDDFEPTPRTLDESDYRYEELVKAGAEPGAEYVFTDPQDEFDLPFPMIRGAGYEMLLIPVENILQYECTELE